MGFGDLGNAVIIITIFILIQFLLTLSAGVADIKNNWDLYKCNPAVLPFASMFGHDTQQTFNECVKNSQVNFMSVFLEPIYASLGYFASNGAIFTELFQRLKLFGDAENAAMGDFADITSMRLRGLVSSTNDVYINITDSFSKITATIAILYRVIQTSLFMGKQATFELPNTIVSLAIGSPRNSRGNYDAAKDLDENYN